MIARLTGRLAEVTGDAALVDVNGIAYEVLVPAYLVPQLQARLRAGDREATLHTLHYIDGGVGGSQMRPRLIGFLDRADRDFFQVFTTVKGIGTRKALRAMADEPASIAARIEASDTRGLARLPEIGKRTAERMVAELRGKLERFVLEHHAAVAEPAFKIKAIDVLVGLQLTHAEAEQLVKQALERDPDIQSEEELIRQAFSSRS